MHETRPLNTLKKGRRKAPSLLSAVHPRNAEKSSSETRTNRGLQHPPSAGSTRVSASLQSNPIPLTRSFYLPRKRQPVPREPRAETLVYSQRTPRMAHTFDSCSDRHQQQQRQQQWAALHSLDTAATPPWEHGNNTAVYSGESPIGDCALLLLLSRTTEKQNHHHQQRDSLLSPLWLLLRVHFWLTK